MFELSVQLFLGDIKAVAARYSYGPDVAVFERLAPAVRDRGHMTKADLLAVAQWKSPRAVPKIATNDEGLIVEATSIALLSRHERLRMGALESLFGVGYPMASVVLHWFHADRYPIIDYRTLWSLGVAKPPAFYTFDFWWSYVTFCRQLAEEAQVDMRTLDRALWQYSKENQPVKWAEAE